MTTKMHNPESVFPPYANYSHAVELAEGSRLLFISGLNGFLANGTDMPESFDEQAELIWRHIGEILTSAGMDFANIVSLRTYLADPAYDEPNVAMRSRFLGTNRPASTVIGCQLLEPAWKLEIEAVAAA